MISEDAKILSRRMELHLMNNRFEACEDILKDAKTEYERGSQEITAIAELNISLKVINQLEKKGYIYIKDLDGIEVERLHEETRYMSEAENGGLMIALRKAKEYNARRQECKMLI